MDNQKKLSPLLQNQGDFFIFAL